MTVETAELYLIAFDKDSIGAWCRALNASDGEGFDPDSPNGELEAAVSRLRKCWWHEGTREQRKAVHEAASALRFEIQEIRRLEKEPA